MRALGRIVQRLLMDAQQRITFRVQAFVRDQIVAHRPTAAEIAAFPCRQRAAAAAAEAAEGVAATTPPPAGAARAASGCGT